MMTNTKWLRRALLGGVALSVMATGAHADELTDLKGQLEALQTRVNQLEQQPQMPALPEGASFLTMSRGSTDVGHVGTRSAVHDDNPAERGFTIAVTPTADLPAPVAEVVVYGFVKGDVIVDFDKDLGDTFAIRNLHVSSGAEDDVHVRLHARQSRFGIDSRTDTAIGQIRTKIEGDFFSGGNVFRLRHAYGQWDMTPNWTLMVGQSWRTGVLLPIGVTTVDFSGPVGHGFPRAAQVRLTYHAGPISWAVAAEAPSNTSAAEWPDLAAYITYDLPGGHELIASGALGDEANGIGGDVGWMVAAGANVNLVDIATLTGSFVYTEDGMHCTYISRSSFWGGCDSTIDIDKGGANLLPVADFFADRAWAVKVGMNFNINETTSFNAAYGFARLENGFNNDIADEVDIQTVHANILWQPVRQMRLGWEVMWGEYDIDAGPRFNPNEATSRDAFRGQFGAWFFF